jgi:transcriptional regulator with XRE-family HTH domain
MPARTVDTRPPDQSKLIIGRRIREARVDADMSQHDLALRLGVTAGAVGQWEIGITIPKSQTLNRLPGILGVSHDWLVGESNQQHRVAQTKAEETILRLSRRLSPDEQAMLIRQLMGLVSSR